MIIVRSIDSLKTIGRHSLNFGIALEVLFSSCYNVYAFYGSLFITFMLCERRACMASCIFRGWDIHYRGHCSFKVGYGMRDQIFPIQMALHFQI